MSNSLTKVLILGDAKVGKTSLMVRLVNGKFTDRYKESIGSDFLAFKTRTATYQLWDFAGRDLPTINPSIFKGADIALFVFDIAEQNSFNKIPTYLAQFKLNAGEGPFRLILIGNKVDQEEERKVTHQQASDYARANDMTYIEYSSKADLQETLKSALDSAVRSLRTASVADQRPTSSPLYTPPHAKSISQLREFYKGQIGSCFTLFMNIPLKNKKVAALDALEKKLFEGRDPKQSAKDILAAHPNILDGKRMLKLFSTILGEDARKCVTNTEKQANFDL